MDKSSCFCFSMGFWAFTLLLIGASIVSGGKVDNNRIISTDQIMEIFRQTSDFIGKSRDPVTIQGNNARQNMQKFLKTRFSQIAATAASGETQSQGDESAPKNYESLEQTFLSKVYATSQQQKDVQASNYILVFQGSANESDDEPLVILANYDTDISEPNPIDDNGSGVAGLVAIGDYLAQQISTEKLYLKNTVILAATDTCISKYEFGTAIDGRSGANALVRLWLPNFMKNRKRFAGAIVLDSIMNYNGNVRSQTDSNEFSKSFPSAYQQMARNEFKGNFLGIVQRDDHLDNPLVQAFERGWMQSERLLKNYLSDSSSINPELIKFSFTNQTLNTEAEFHFLRSEQTQFWNHFVARSSKMYPAILLTDTEKYRKPYSCVSSCSLMQMTVEGNMRFLQRIIMAVYSTIEELQTDPSRNGVARGILPQTTPVITTLSMLLFYMFGNILN